ncbi:MAG: membrane protein insertase YidC, partial [Acidobacteriota bacterium]
DERLAQAVYEVKGVFQEKLQAPTELRFYYRDDRIEVNRTIRVPATGYLLEMETEVRLEGRSIPFKIVLGPGLGESEMPSSVDFAQPSVAYYQHGAVTRYTADDVEDGPVQLPGPARWVALDSQYFTYLVLSPEGVRSIQIAKTEAHTDTADGGSESQALVGAEVELAPAAPHAVFIGPKDHEILGQAETTLSQLIDYGWFGFLVKPLLLSLRFVYGYVHNYGWAIIILTFFINLALFPVRYKQMVSMKKMAHLQPQMKAIQAKYKNMKRDDPRRQKMNEEVMAMYKKHGVNPLGGCLPLLIQMPFLFAFYRMLFSSIELRGAPFIGWIQDLSQHDPYYITPIVMGVSMVAQQQMTPATGDATQRRMMMLMPVVFTFFFLSFSSGLVLYFLCSNLFGMMFQLLMQRWTPEMAAPDPEKRTEKKK